MADLTIVQLVEELQPDLLHQQATQRCRAVSNFAMILEHLGPNWKGLNDKEIELITEFFCSKLKDHHSIIPAALRGLERRAVYKTLENLLTFHLKGTK